MTEYTPIKNQPAPSSGYGFRTSEEGVRTFHYGIDIPSLGGTPVRAYADGLVTTSTMSQAADGGYGQFIIIDHGLKQRRGSTETVYAHLLEGSQRVSKGDKVTAGQIIGLVGQSGNATIDHLHFEVRYNGSPIDPINVLRQIPEETEKPAAQKAGQILPIGDIEMVENKDGEIAGAIIKPAPKKARASRSKKAGN